MRDENIPDEGAWLQCETKRGIDYQALFAVTPSPYMVLGPDLVIADVNEAACEVTGRTREDLLGRYLFDAFPENPADPGADGVRKLHASLHRVLRSKERDTMAPMKYDIPVADQPSVFEERWWSAINTPVLGPDGQVVWIIHRGEDVTAFILAHPRSRDGGALSDAEAMEVELYARARELQRLNEELREAHARERQVALTLQEAMLHSPHLAQHRDTAVRYLPAAGSLNVCGDWYEVIDLSENRFAVAVGDVVGHGLEAAAVMGMLRSALSVSVRSVDGPASALDCLGLYARDVEGALATTVVQAVVDTDTRRITYSSAGHPPPVLLHEDGTYNLLDQATDPPLGARPKHHPRSQANLPYTPGDTLVLYTDGLIERRGEDIDAGLQRLTHALARFARHSPERVADALLAHLGVSSGARDDIALIVLRL
ncbi:SpoIIE family protein phosphatase [Streptomyces sp. Li-HN-5-11]|uniref:PP2C family protein-serine/threonine phosphatase n=1 Tax=Streptomyces sp. Li-HN-5-11 TaxID=3075432 RepID=UPI0028ADE1EB|nr:SpoIIE family protein phosphatase [Streptomyces sp. Li-HN-5-11]WNM33629.1 SpoIIE family protein phosphatase [Streptomyces sp. Li-HN-5-11]